jgi:hypothetical protein
VTKKKSGLAEEIVFPFLVFGKGMNHIISGQKW